MGRANDPNAPTHIIPPETSAADVRQLRRDLENANKLLKDALNERQRAVEMAYSWKERAETAERQPEISRMRVQDIIDRWWGGLSPQGKSHMSTHDSARLVSMLLEGVL